MQVAKVMILSVYLHLACQESLKFNLYFINFKTYERTFQDKEWNRSTMFLATRVRKDSVFNAYFTWEKRSASFDKYWWWKPLGLIYVSAYWVLVYYKFTIDVTD